MTPRTLLLILTLGTIAGAAPVLISPLFSSSESPTPISAPNHPWDGSYANISDNYYVGSPLESIQYRSGILYKLNSTGIYESSPDNIEWSRKAVVTKYGYVYYTYD